MCFYNAGSMCEYKIEFLSSYDFTLQGICNPAAPILCKPKNYKNNGYNENAIAFPPPTLANWNSDVYANWLAQNNASLNAQYDIAGNNLVTFGKQGLIGEGKAFASLITGNIWGSINTSTDILSDLVGAENTYENTILGLNAKITDHSVQPPQAKGHTTSSSAQVKYLSLFTAFRTTIRKEYAKIIDDYFEMFGYKVNRLKVPNTKNRPEWNYVKTSVCNLSTSISSVDANELKKLYDNGLTIWHNPQNVGNYSLNNH